MGVSEVPDRRRFSSFGPAGEPEGVEGAPKQTAAGQTDAPGAAGQAGQADRGAAAGAVGPGSDPEALSAAILAKLPAADRPVLARLRAEGRIGQLDLEVLHATIASPRHPVLGAQRPPITGADIASQAIRAIDDPRRIGSGSAAGADGPAAIEYALARNEPQRFLAAVEGLTSERGRTDLAGAGYGLKLPANAVPRDSSGRSDIDRMLQSAVQESVRAKGGPKGLAAAYEAVTFPATSAEVGLRGSARRVGNLFAKQPEEGRSIPVEMRFGSGGGRWANVDAVERDARGRPAAVLLRTSGGEDPDGTGRLAQATGQKGLFRVRWEDFVGNVESAVIPGRAPATDALKRPVVVRADVSSAFGPGVNVAVAGQNFELGVTAYREHTAVGATYAFGGSQTQPFVSAGLVGRRGDFLPGQGEDRAMARAGVRHTLRSGVEVGAYVGGSSRLSGSPRIGAEMGVSVGYRVGPVVR